MNPKTTKKARFKAVSSYPVKKVVPPPLPQYFKPQQKYITQRNDMGQRFAQLVRLRGQYQHVLNVDHNHSEIIKDISTYNKYYLVYIASRTQLYDVNDPSQIAMEYIYIGTVIIDRENSVYKIQSATVSGVEPHEMIKKDHPDIFHNSFLAIRSYQKEEGVQGYPLAPGNVIRLGRVQYVVLEVRNQANSEIYKQTSHLQLNTGNYVVEAPLTGCCKICLCEESTEEDPLISPCICKGSCQFIHVGCLKNWINSKVKKQLNDIVVSYNFSKFECQICKAPFPKTVTQLQGPPLQMLTIQKPSKPYLILQTVTSKEDTKRQRNLHMIFSNEGLALKVGRGHQCQMRVNDISVSRVHAEVRFDKEKGKFYIKDMKSKFGTLVKFKQQFDIRDGLCLQYGRVCLEFNIKREHPKPKQQIQTNEDDNGDNYY